LTATARRKHIHTSPRFLAVGLEAQLLPGTFEHALNHLLDRRADLRTFGARFTNDHTVASAHPPAMLLKVDLLAYVRGIVSSRGIEHACREHITLVAVSGDTCPHFTTIASFISGLGDLIRCGVQAGAAHLRRQGLGSGARCSPSTASIGPPTPPRNATACEPVCPARQALQGNGRECKIGGCVAIKFRGSESAYGPRTQRDKCLRTPAKTRTRQVAFFIGKVPGKNVLAERTQQRIDSAEGHATGYVQRSIGAAQASLGDRSAPAEFPPVGRIGATQTKKRTRHGGANSMRAEKRSF
jgi:hypothetical protein